MTRRFGTILCCAVATIAIGVLIYRPTSGPPKYCRVRFGNEEMHEIIIASTTDSLLLFRSGDVKEKPERYPLKRLQSTQGDVTWHLAFGVVIPPIDVGEGASYRITDVGQSSDEVPVPRHNLFIHVEVKADISYLQCCRVELGDSVDQMRTAHFDGPLSVGPYPRKVTGKRVPFVIGGEPIEIRANVGTIDKTGSCETYVKSGDVNFPEGVHPTVTVEFPTAGSATPIVCTYPLDQFC